MSQRSELLEHALLSAWVVTSTSLLVHAYYEGAFVDYAWWIVPALFVLSFAVAWSSERGRRRRRMRYPDGYKQTDLAEIERSPE